MPDLFEAEVAAFMQPRARAMKEALPDLCGLECEIYDPEVELLALCKGRVRQALLKDGGGIEVDLSLYEVDQFPKCRRI